MNANLWFSSKNCCATSPLSPCTQGGEGSGVRGLETSQEVLDHKTNPWGITIQSVEIRDVSIPENLQDAMSKQAQAERERQARIILGTAETEIASKFVEAALPYQNNPVAIHLRAMNMLYEGLKEKGSMIIVPSSALESMNLGAIGGLAALSQSTAPDGKGK
jgi:regulator of protease activity HflC (stomatin/prohibitin superfamily)